MKADDDENIPYAVSELTSNSLKFSYSGNGQQIEYEFTNYIKPSCL
tara:strand:- start:116 stop:253 length:138 start_codon:yes stop_codon:yes gene_type:complete